jgi:hypothetical protein
MSVAVSISYRCLLLQVDKEETIVWYLGLLHVFMIQSQYGSS